MLVREFLSRRRREGGPAPPSLVSLFSGAGLSDLGYELAGFEVAVLAEKEKHRAVLCQKNFPAAEVVVGNIQETGKTVIDEYRDRYPEKQLSLLSVTPPCQGMSSSNPDLGRRGNGSRDDRNMLLLHAVPIVDELKPRIIVVENVPQILTEPHHHRTEGETVSIIDAFTGELKDYFFFGGVVQVADYGVPQDRRRAIIVAVRKDEGWGSQLLAAEVGPWPAPTHAADPEDGLLPWITLEQWFEEMQYPELDAGSPETAKDPQDPLHQVPVYEGNYYLRVADIPPRSGRSAYQTSWCRNCDREDVPEGTATCPYCGAVMRNRPHLTEEDGTVRLIKGRHSSYRRMRHDEPARTITTATSHVGSDYKIHPWENRVLSVRECADLQTIPRFYDWSWAFETRHVYLTRVVIGEALPPWFTFLQGELLVELLTGEPPPIDSFAPCRWTRGHRVQEETREPSRR